MDVTRHNLRDYFQLIKESIHQAEFIAIDTEFTGHTVGKQDSTHAYDLIEELYQKLKYGCQRFKAIQLGICTFKWDSHENQYIARPFNFYILNYTEMFDGVFKVRADCLNFLSGHGFNFDKLHKDGITYQRLSEKEKIMNAVKHKTEQDWVPYQKRDQTKLSKGNQKKLTEILQQTQELAESKENFIKLTDIESNTLKLEIMNKVQAQFPGMIVEFTNAKSEVKIKKGKKFKAAAVSTEGTAETESVKTEETKQEVGLAETSEDAFNQYVTLNFEKEMGFSLVIEEMIKAKKPLVGHNFIYDVAFLYDQFIAPLPDTFLEFSQQWRD